MKAGHFQAAQTSDATGVHCYCYKQLEHCNQRMRLDELYIYVNKSKLNSCKECHLVIKHRKTRAKETKSMIHIKKLTKYSSRRCKINALFENDATNQKVQISGHESSAGNKRFDKHHGNQYIDINCIQHTLPAGT